MLSTYQNSWIKDHRTLKLPNNRVGPFNHFSEINKRFLLIYRIVSSTNTCYYSENQVFGGVTIRVLCSKKGVLLTETCH